MSLPGLTRQSRSMYYVYILASGKNGTIYIGVTNNIIRRMYEHKNKIQKGFTAKYNVDRLVYLEEVEDVLSAINREKRLKKYKREWKISLIEQENPGWQDLSMEFLDSPIKSANDV